MEKKKKKVLISRFAWNMVSMWIFMHVRIVWQRYEFFFFFDKVTFFNWHIYHFFLLFYFNLNLYIAFHYPSFLWWNFGKHESRIQWTKHLHRENPTTSGPWTWDHKSLSWVHFKLTHPIKPKIYILSWFFFFWVNYFLNFIIFYLKCFI